MFGIPFDINGLSSISGSDETYVIEDAASALGTRRKDGKYAGTFSDIGFYSFNRGKNLSTTSGGLIVTERDDLAPIISEEVNRLPGLETSGKLTLFLKTLGLSMAVRPWFYTLMKPLISKYKYTELHTDFDSFEYTKFQKALGVSLFKRADWIFKRRMENGLFLKDTLKDIDGIRLPVLPDDWDIVFNQFPILVESPDKRDMVLKGILETGVEATILYDNPIHMIYEDHSPSDDPFPNSTFLAKRLILIPTHPIIRIKDLQRVAESIRMTLKKKI
jgi:dTDP-4-amino-4,6-dideoxygalactose transaminase